MNNLLLYDAQLAALKSVNRLPQTYWKNYDTFENGFTGKALWLCNRTYYVGSFLNYSLRHVVSSIFLLLNNIFGFLPNRLIDAIYPINIINNRRHFVTPRIIDRILGEWVFHPIATYGMTKKNDGCVNEVFSKLLSKNQDLINPEREKIKFNYHINTAHSSKLNAFSTSAGGIVVFDKLVNEIKTSIEEKSITFANVKLASGETVRLELNDVKLDDVLAALIGHEITHIASRHSIVRLIIECIVSILFVICHFILSDKLSNCIENIANSIKNVIISFFSRKDEYEADVTGVYLAKSAGFNPLGAIYLQQFFKEIKFSIFLHKHAEVMFSHPYPGNRKRAIYSAITVIAQDALQQDARKL